MKHITSGSVVIARLNQGESLIDTLEAVLRETYSRNAIVQFGIGSLDALEFGVLPPEGPHKRHTLEGPVELVNLSGLIVGKDNAGPYGSHLHVAVAPQDGIIRGGHLFSAKVGLIAEVGLMPVHDGRLRRVRHPERQVELLEI